MNALTNQNGIILALTILTISVMMVLMASMVPLGIGNYHIAKSMTVDRVEGFQLCDIGFAEAQDMIFQNRTSDLSPAGSFLDANYDPDPVYMDIDDFSFSSSLQDGSDVKIDIGADAGNGRTIVTTSIDHIN